MNQQKVYSSLLISFLSFFLFQSCSSGAKKDAAKVLSTPPMASTTAPAPASGANIKSDTKDTSKSQAVTNQSKSQVAAGQEMEIKLRNQKGQIVKASKPQTEIASQATKADGNTPAENITADSTAAVASPPVSHREIGPVSADKALNWLKNGNTRYVKGFLRNDGQKKTDRDRLSQGQHPHTIVLSCSDSRVPPEIVFDQKLGEIFVIRNAGNNSDATTTASIEYALEHLGANLIVVMGHESCGAVKAAFSGGKTNSPFLDRLITQVGNRINRTNKTVASNGYIDEGWENTSTVAQELMKKSQIVRDAVESGSVKIQTALYHLDGKVEWK